MTPEVTTVEAPVRDPGLGTTEDPEASTEAAEPERTTTVADAKPTTAYVVASSKSSSVIEPNSEAHQQQQLSLVLPLQRDGRRSTGSGGGGIEGEQRRRLRRLLGELSLVGCSNAVR